MTTQAIDRERWLTEAAHMILADIIEPVTALPEASFKVSVGFPSGKPSKVIAQCWRKEASAGGFNEIFVTPLIDDSLQILEALAHELVHYSDNCASGHRNHFARVARAIGLKGQLTATYAGEALKAMLAEIVDVLGPIPHSKIDLSKTGTKKQGTRMIKVECQNSACSFSFRTSQAQLDKLTATACCPACDQAALKQV